MYSDIQGVGTRRWYLIHTKPACEHIARDNLERQGYCAYYPRLLRHDCVRGRQSDRIVALFPRYLFLQLEVESQALGPARSTVGVSNVVRFGCEYAVVPDSVVEGLRAQADPATDLHRLCSRPRLEAGTRVHVVAGMFDGLEGIFLRESGKERVVVLLEVLGQGTPVRIPAAFVAPQAQFQANPSVPWATDHAHR